MVILYWFPIRSSTIHGLSYFEIGLFHLIGVHPPIDDTVRGSKNISYQGIKTGQEVCIFPYTSVNS